VIKKITLLFIGHPLPSKDGHAQFFCTGKRSWVSFTEILYLIFVGIPCRFAGENISNVPLRALERGKEATTKEGFEGIRPFQGGTCVF